MNELVYPFDAGLITRKYKRLQKKLLSNGEAKLEKRIAVLGGSTTSFFIQSLELFLLNNGIKPEFYESDYNKFYEEAVFENEKLRRFSPEIVVIFTSVVNILQWPSAADRPSDIEDRLQTEYERYERVWSALKRQYNCLIIQNNFDYPVFRNIGNGEAGDFRGAIRFINRLNERFAEYGDSHKGFYIHDISYLAAKYGAPVWHDRNQYYAYKLAFSMEVIPYISFSCAKLIQSIMGRSKKCLVLDLDNTLWGGVIGEDGLEGMILGNETPRAEAYAEFQRYLLSLKERGILLAICSKNDENIAKLGFQHPDSILKLEDFSAFYVNWEQKDVNIIRMSKELNLGLDSFVFIDDNPTERELVRKQLPMVAVPEIDPKNVFSYIVAIDDGGFFEQVSISEEDLKRNENYRAQKEFRAYAQTFENYEDFLGSLEMKAEISAFQPIYYERIAQLTNKSNQFNLTTRRCTVSEIEQFAKSDSCITLYARLSDKFGDNGLVSVLAGTIHAQRLDIDVWLMSCRVLKRDLEKAVFDELVNRCRSKGLSSIRGYYYATEKNTIVKDHYAELGFCLLEKNNEDSIWEYDLTVEKHKLNRVIEVNSCEG